MPATCEAPSRDDGECGADAEPRPRLRLDVIDEDGDWSRFEPVAEALRAVEAALGRHPAVSMRLPAAACVALSSDAAVRSLNRTYRGQDKPTNVLSFPAARAAAPAAHAPHHLGDVVLAAETVLAESIDLNIPPRHHLQHLVVHGALHLLGYDHETSADAAVMERLEVELLASLGVGNPYRDDVV